MVRVANGGMRIGLAVVFATACARNGTTPGGDGGVIPDSTVAPFQPSLGAHWTSDASAVTFRVASTRATRIELELFDQATGVMPIRRIVLDQASDVFSTQVAAADLPATIYYGYRAWGPNWPFDPAWQPGNDAGWIADVDAAGLARRLHPARSLRVRCERERASVAVRSVERRHHGELFVGARR